MKQPLVILGAALVFTAYLPANLSAQLWEAGLAGEELGSVALHFGAFVPRTTLPDGGSWETGTAVGASLGLWAHPNLGFRMQVIRTYTEGVQPGGDLYSAAAENAGRVWTYSGEVALRYPIMDGRAAPFISGGPAGKSYRWKYGMYKGGTAFAWTAAGGLDFRPTASGTLGLVVEARYYRSNYLWHGVSWKGPMPDFERTAPTVNDIMITGGVALNF